MNIFFVLFIVFLVLKLTEVIAWSWWLVTLPLWWPISVIVIGAIGMLLGRSVIKAADSTETLYHKLKRKK